MRQSFPSILIVKKCLNINSINDILFSPRLRNLLNWQGTFCFGPPILICVTPNISLLFPSMFLNCGLPSQLFCICSLAQLKIICKIFTASSPNVWGIDVIVCNIANATTKAADTCVVSSACIPSTFSLSLFCL